MPRNRPPASPNRLQMETLEDRHLLTIAIRPPATTPDKPAIEPQSPEPPVAETQFLSLREDAATGIHFDDTRIGNVFLSNATGSERYVNLTQRDDGSREHALFGVANLFELLPANHGGRQIEIVSASLTLFATVEMGVGSRASVHPITSSWLRSAPGENETEQALYETSSWQASEFSAADYSSVGNSVSWVAGSNTLDVTSSIRSMYASGNNQGVVVVPQSGPSGARVDLLIATSEHWIVEARPRFEIEYRYIEETSDPIGPESPEPDTKPVEPNPVRPDVPQKTDTPKPDPKPIDPDVEQNSPGKLSSTTRVFSQAIANPANPSVSLTRYYGEGGNLDLISHAQSGELTGFSPDGKWHHMLLGNENWYLRNVETGEIRFAHHVTAGHASHSYFQWTERNNYLRFGGPAILEEIDPDTRRVVNRTELSAAQLTPEDQERVDYAQFRTGQSSGADGIYVEQRISLDDSKQQRWFINVIDTAGGGLKEKYAYEFDSAVHNGDAIANRWRELYFTNNTFNVHLSPFGREGTGHNGEGGDLYYNFPENGDGGGWRQVSLIEGSSNLVLQEIQSHRTLETINGVTYVAYATWRGRDSYVVVAEQVSGKEIAAIPISNTQFAVHLHFFQNEVVYGVADVSPPSAPVRYERVESFVVDVDSQTAGPREVIADVRTVRTDNFHSHARVFTDAGGSYCWHTNEFSSGDAIDMVCGVSSNPSSEPAFNLSPQDPNEPVASPTPTDSVFASFLSISRQFTAEGGTEVASSLETLKKIAQLSNQ